VIPTDDILTQNPNKLFGLSGNLSFCYYYYYEGTKTRQRERERERRGQ